MSKKFSSDSYNKQISIPLVENKLHYTPMVTKDMDSSMHINAQKGQFKKVNSQIVNNEKLLSKKLEKEQIFTDLMTRHNELYRVWRLADLITAILTTIGLVFALIDYEMGYKVERDSRAKISVEREVIRIIT